LGAAAVALAVAARAAIVVTGVAVVVVVVVLKVDEELLGQADNGAVVVTVVVEGVGAVGATVVVVVVVVGLAGQTGAARGAVVTVGMGALLWKDGLCWCCGSEGEVCIIIMLLVGSVGLHAEFNNGAGGCRNTMALLDGS
jgi:hypothetical protein